jgi:organic hydroperoxide reductase OsmC/OhrA
MSPDYFLQVAAYAACFAEQYSVPLPQKCYIIKFHKTEAIYEVVEVDNIEKHFEAFLSAKKLKEDIEEISNSLK